MITDPRVFDEAYRPRTLLHRDRELDQLMRALRPAAGGHGAEDLLVSGPSGVGKTSLVRHGLDVLDDHVAVEHFYVRALGQTTGAILRAILQAHPDADPAAAARNRPVDALRADLIDVVDDPVVVVLDEADDVPGTDLLDHLAGIPAISVVAICHSPQKWRARLGSASPTRWGGEHHLALDRFGVDELADILDRRARQGLVPTAVRRDQLERIADEVAGVARHGIQALRAAAELAGERGHARIRAEDVDDAFDRAERRILAANLRSLPVHHQVLYELVRRSGPLPVVQLHERYEAIAADVYEGRPRTPIGKRARRNKLAKLRDYGLVEVDGERQFRVYRAVDDGIEAPNNFIKQSGEI